MRFSALSSLLRRALCGVLALCALTSMALADSKVMLLEDTTGDKYRFTVAPDGSRVFISASRYFVYDAGGRLVDRIGVPQGCACRDLLPLPADYDPLIKYISCTSYAGGHLATTRADGSEINTIVGRGGGETVFHPDNTGWTNPLGATLDMKNKLLFAIESSQAAQGQPNPAWSRIAEFDLSGKFIRSINFFNCEAAPGTPERDDARRMWYQDVKVDAQRRRVYVLSSTTRELIGFDYDGKLVGRTPVQIGDSTGLAVLADGRIAVGCGLNITLFDPDTFKAHGSVAMPAEIGNDYQGIRCLQTDGTGRLYALLGDQRVNFIRWAPDLKSAEVFGPRYLGVNVDFPDNALTSGAPFTIHVAASGRPAPTQLDRWQVMARPGDGRDLRWQPLPADYAAGVLTVHPPAALRGVYELAVRAGDGPISYAGRGNDPSLQRSVVFVPAGARGSLAFFPSSGRTAFRQGEEIAVQLVRRPPEKAAVPAIDVSCVLEDEGVALLTRHVTLGQTAALRLPAALTTRLLPGHYLLRPTSAEADECYDFPFDIAANQPDSPMQRVLYHEFGNAAVNGDTGGADMPERLYYERDTIDTVHRLGFTRETDRSWPGHEGIGWRRENAPADLSKQPGYAPAEYYALSTWGSPQDFYFDQAVRNGVDYDAQILPHCASVRVRDERIAELLPGLTATAQWAGRYPSFYGFNYNDEMFFWSNYDDRWHQDDTDWFNAKIKEQLKGDKPAAYLWALNKMYHGFNEVVQRVNPALRRTTTPMWQFPAVEGSYAPTIYREMTESYSHFLSEGYALPFVPAHSADMLRRPGLPHIGIADNGYNVTGGDLYQKTTMQLFTRGTQGVGVSHTTAFQDPNGAQAYRTTNELAAMYGSIFARATRADEAAVLYSYAQDVTETRAGMGTPHWERVYGLYGAGLMAGVPMTILYEEDVSAGWLLEGGKPRVPMLFLVGQKAPLPAPVLAAIDRYRAAGGKVFTDDGCADFPGATKLGFNTHVESNLGYASDTAWPLQQPIFARIAADLRPIVEANLRYPMSTNDPWVVKSSYRAGAARYLVLATETSPFPWDAGSVWGLGAFYCKNAFTWLPKTVTFTFPATTGVVYDVFEHTIVKPVRQGATTTLQADLTTFPGRLYAVLPAPLGAPRLATSNVLAGGAFRYEVTVVDSTGKRLAAQVPLRIRLLDGQRVGQELFRSTDANGMFADNIVIPLAGTWALEVSELLGGKSSVARVPTWPAPAQWLTERPAVEIQRPQQLRTLLAEARKAGKLLLVKDAYTQLSDAQCEQLRAALAGAGITLSVAELSKNAAPAIYLSAGIAGNDNFLGPLINAAWNKNLFDYPRAGSVPGAGRGFITSAFSARNFGEDCLVLVGGDKDGLDNTLATFLHWVKTPAEETAPSPAPVKVFPVIDNGKGSYVTALPTLHNELGVRLSAVRVAFDGTHLAVSANGYLKNLALLADEGDHARLLRTTRVGQAPTTDSLFVSDDGGSFGASGRTTERFAQGMYLTDSATGAQHVFAGFGDIGRNVNRFAASADGRTVVTTGAYGAVCWGRDGDAWKERWSYDYWKSFNTLEWPISDLRERIPQFHAVIPHGADYVLLLFGEFSNNGWVTAENPCSAQLMALNLNDGATRWKYDVPIPRTLLFPTIFASPDGAQMLLQVQMGSWGKETYRFFTIDTKTGAQRAQWDAPVAPTGIGVADGSGRIAEAYANRLLEVREQDGTLRYNILWPEHMPVSVAFAPDGQGLYVADDAGMLTALDGAGAPRWKIDMGCLSTLGAGAKGVYAAGWDGRLRAFTADGALRWSYNCTPELQVANPMSALAATTVPATALHIAVRPANTSTAVPQGVNLLRAGKATLTVGGTSGWQSSGQVQVMAEDLTNGKTDDVTTPWMSQNELFWDGSAGRQVWAQITFPAPTDVSTLTVYENPNHPKSWPTDALVQVWDEAQQSWKTAVYGVFLNSEVNTYTLNLKGVSKLRYAPWGSYYRNFYTSEIEVR